MRRRRLLDSCLLATTLRGAPVRAMESNVPASWVAPSPTERVARLLATKHDEPDQKRAET
jgi:hypothetical protein